MADRYRSRQVQQRQPLGPGDMRANMHPASQRPTKSAQVASSPRNIPNNLSMDNSPVQVRSSPAESSAANRVAAIVNESKRNSKRDSEISNASSTTSSSGRKRLIGRWQLGKTIGRGGCSTVRMVRHIDSGQVGAVKIISRKMAEQVRAQSLANLAATPEKSLQDLVAAGKAAAPPPPGLMREITIMKLLDHPNIIKLFDVWENHNELYLIMEVVEGGELFHYVERQRGLVEKEAVYIFRQIIAALLYCHRLHIHHRDLKPENILLDTANNQIKIVDFGMAALQPEGKKLTTACGSPHYAAPEVIKSRPYDGAKADVWSCGVILYVMLTGTTPFNYDAERNLNVMYHAIANAEYYMPQELAFEAKDLLRRIFVPRPEKRISMDEIWEHPFLHKYDRDFGYEGAWRNKEAWIGPVPTLDEWTVTREEDIDKEILRNMRTLWHSVPQPVLIKNLTSQQPNQEKYFYAALLKHREEHLENYMGGADGVAYSPSDHHHIRPDSTVEPSAPQEKQQSQSSYSIMNNEHLRSNSIPAMPEVPPSDGSFDPYKPSRYALTDVDANSTRVVVHSRGNSQSGKHIHQQHLRHPAALRVEMLKKANRHSVIQASRSNSRMASPTPKATRRMSRNSLASRQSLSSSVWPSSPPVAVAIKTHSSHKRNVSFQNVRKTSAGSGLGTAESVTGSIAEKYTPELQAKAQKTQQQVSEDQRMQASSPTEARKSRIPGSTPQSRRRDSNTPGHLIRKEVRKVSSELEKACEEAFFRTSFGSSAQTSVTERQSPYDTPPSSFSGYNEPGRRPLPALPTDTPNTFLARTLEETRKKIVARSATEGDGNSAKYQEILASLDKIIPAAAGDAEYQKRITSAPEPQSAADLGFLPIITEEALPDTLRIGKSGPGAGHRSFTAPGPPKGQSTRQQNGETIRMVQPSPNPKSYNGSQLDDTAEEIARPKTADGSSNKKHLQVPNPHDYMTRNKSHDSAIGLRNSPPQEEFPPELAKKKSSWFRRWKDTSAAESKTTSQAIPSDWKELDDRQNKNKPNVIKRGKEAPPALKLDSPADVQPPHGTDSSEFPMRTPGSASEGKGFSKWFGKKPWEKKDEPIKSADFMEPIPSPSLATTPPAAQGEPITPSTPAEPTRSWFARFLRIRPESRVLCFAIPRGRARNEVYRLLRDWQRHGICDLTYFPQDNAITARVDKVNALGIKPVAFRVELYVVLQNGKKVGLSLGRWTQVRGAASSFRRVVDIVDEVLMLKGVMVKEEEKRKELEGILLT